MKEQITVRLPEYSFDEIEDIKKFYKSKFKDVDDPTTTDIIRRSIHYLWIEVDKENNISTD